MAIKVIGAGLGRTGTMSLKLALEQLGFEKCYHMLELLNHPEDVAYWEAASRGEAVDWDALFTGYGAAVDYPACWHYKTLMAYYSEAKVILSVRDPEAWYESALATIYRKDPPRLQTLLLRAWLPFSPRLRQISRVIALSDDIWQKDFEGRFEDRAFALERFTAHKEEVKRSVPADRLLVYEVKEGWEPLCTFLNVSIPQTPFPRVNDRKTFVERQKRIIVPLLRGELKP